ncbi:hypothetical protein BATDEDRAFT_92056 [Batrachochytrium dendrobatidis JAM81]|uniref:Uncharacterized protein n=1 Tax=Batrachochytrium dendrobatidis (strain JAM81 / FGSC 10211) TaxID=684364 RepID=F4PCI2_BATDJ|nr:uncharacterized protein BATDEDRAFT_92056 [Batrachochytrium dendrobatidis JAM81]EGF77092.1 hypothetical protein BATDEDRAFT_92056 [Batrachochytrium dendrobatidis JAM81]KAK5665420.1 hypothetical protein QVD99_007771 [Batrachochytrium dendrobatidis]|eukprot:XP_006682271.1 hypothetical protein BATDEDRAFT_92056 [Batrachochytrium dendrobatidis JAM81]
MNVVVPSSRQLEEARLTPPSHSQFHQTQEYFQAGQSKITLKPPKLEQIFPNFISFWIATVATTARISPSCSSIRWSVISPFLLSTKLCLPLIT